MHAASQAPQWAFEEVRRTHAPLQFVVPAAQESLHWPAEQTSPVAQDSPQAPQCSGLLDTSTQDSPHASNPASQPLPQMPRSQTAAPSGGAWHRTPQLPQLSGSRETTTQRPSQTVWPSSHLTS
jgi:hypothetical protein